MLTEAMRQTGHAKQSDSCFARRARVSRLVGFTIGQRVGIRFSGG